MTLNIAIVTGSTRPGRQNEAVARWVYELAAAKGKARYEFVDIAAFELGLPDEPRPPIEVDYTQPHTHPWAQQIAFFDAFVFVTPEYNHSISGALKNALDFLFHEWNDKAAGFVSYGVTGGARAVEHLRCIMAALKIADVRTQVMLSRSDDFDQAGHFKPLPQHGAEVDELLDQLIEWGEALRSVRLARGAGGRGLSR
jgi:NAD(P)H-dependent FMN reductase